MADMAAALVPTLRGRAMRMLGMVAGAVPSAILFLTGVRFLQIAAIQRIGHQAVEIDCYVKETLLGLRPRRLGVVLAPRDRVANAALSRYWRRYVVVVEHPAACRLLNVFLRYPYLRIDMVRYMVAINATAEYISLQNLWGDRGPTLVLTSEDRERGRALLHGLGMPQDAWFVCIHSREGGYSPSDEHLHSFRNGDIDTYLPAMEDIAARGGWCVRMGDPTMKPLPSMRNVIDYAHFEERSDWMDLFLCASCRYFLGSTSGLIFLSCVFGVPTGQANAVPLSTALTYGPCDRAIPKLIRSRTLDRYLTFAEILASPVGNYRFAELYDADRLEVRDNTGEEILELSREMLEITGGGARYSKEDDTLQALVKSLFVPGHYTFGSASGLGRDFLRRHRTLIGAHAAPSACEPKP